MTPKQADAKQGRGGLKIAKMRGWFLFRPLAVVLSILLSPVPSLWKTEEGRPAPFEAKAQVSGAACAIPNCILPVTPGPIAGDLLQLEQDAVRAYLELRGMPQTEASKIYDLGRQDLRNQVRAMMFMILSGIITKPPTERTAHEQRLHDWLQNIVKQNEIKMYESAIEHYNTFLGDLCRFRLDTTVADAFGLKFNSAEYCVPGVTVSSVFAPPIPDARYFMAYGFKNSYGAKALEDPKYGAIFTDSALSASEIWTVGLASATFGAFLGGLALGNALYAAVSALLVAQAAVAAGKAALVGAITGTAQAGFVLSGTTVSAGSVILGVAAPVVIIFIAVLTAVVAGITLVKSEQSREELSRLGDTLTRVRNSPMDLVAMANTGASGSYKLMNSFYSQTLPDTPSTAPLPQRQVTDVNFLVTNPLNGLNNLTDTLEYRDWDGYVWAVQNVGFWFVRRCVAVPGGGACTLGDSLTGALRFVDHDGKKWTMMRRDLQFLVTAANPEPLHRDCVLGTRDVRNCRSFISVSVPMQGRNGNRILVGATRLSVPVFNDPGPLTFSVGTPVTRTFTATAFPEATITLVSGPSFFSYPDAAGASSFRVVHSNSLSVPVGTHSITLRAQNAIGSVTQTFQVRVDNVLNIVSPQVLSGVAGRPFSFTVVATGLPTPRLTLDPTGYDLSGLTFRDNGDGTGTLSGIYSSGFTDQQCITGACGGFVATNTFGSVKQNFRIRMTLSPRATVNTPQPVLFYPGLPTELELTTIGAETPVSWDFDLGPLGSWLSLRDNGNGTATLRGTAPQDLAGRTLTPMITPRALGSGFQVLQPFAISVPRFPRIFTQGSTSFTVGSFGSMGINMSNGSLEGATNLPPGLSLVYGSTSNCPTCVGSIQGTPLPGSGGRYTVRVSGNAGSGSTTEEITIDVNEAPAFTSSQLAVMFVGRRGSFDVTTSGYPNAGTRPVAADAGPPTSPPDGSGPVFSIPGLPASLTASNFSPTGLRTGTLTISGTPTAADVGTRQFQVFMNNGVGGQILQTLTLQIVPYNPVVPVNLVTSWVLTRDARGNLLASVVLANHGSQEARNVVINSARINSVTSTPAPAQIASIPAGTTATVRLFFPASATPLASLGFFALSGSHSGGTFNAGGRVILPF